MILYDYYRSSACYRVRTGLNLKGVNYQSKTINLVKNGGEQFSHNYSLINPQKRVPSLVLDNKEVLTQSTAILEYLEACYPTPSFFTRDEVINAKIRMITNIINADIHPLNNLSVLNYLKTEFNITQEKRLVWYQHWIKNGFDVVEKELVDTSRTFCFSEQVTLADLYLVPQVYNAKRFDVNMKMYPNILRVYENLLLNKAFFDASPEQVNNSEASNY